jgi:hypothetical protein
VSHGWRKGERQAIVTAIVSNICISDGMSSLFSVYKPCLFGIALYLSGTSAMKSVFNIFMPTRILFRSTHRHRDGSIDEEKWLPGSGDRLFEMETMGGLFRVGPVPLTYDDVVAIYEGCF